MPRGRAFRRQPKPRLSRQSRAHAAPGPVRPARFSFSKHSLFCRSVSVCLPVAIEKHCARVKSAAFTFEFRLAGTRIFPLFILLYVFASSLACRLPDSRRRDCTVPRRRPVTRPRPAIMSRRKQSNPKPVKRESNYRAITLVRLSAPICPQINRPARRIRVAIPRETLVTQCHCDDFMRRGVGAISASAMN